MSIFPTKILLATEGSEEAQLALRVAVELANSTNSQLHLLTVDMPDLPGYVELLEEAYRKSERHGQQTLDEQEGRGGRRDRGQGALYDGRTTSPKIVKFGAEPLGAGLIVTGSRGLSRIRRALMGSISDSVLRNANPCPCTVTKVSPA